jgi:DNA helicase-2/ATP-dependent DNA helicase PcrA
MALFRMQPLLTDADQDKNRNPDKVALMTIPRIQRDWRLNNLFIVGMEENLFPSQMALASRTDLEEERRLFYVAVPRAMEN